MVASYIDQIIMIFVGGWATAVGYGALPPPVLDPKWVARFGPTFKVIGPVILGVGLVLAAGQFMGWSGR